MLIHKRLLNVVEAIAIASVLALALFVVFSQAGPALAMPAAQDDTPTGSATVFYSGRLLDASGQALDGTYDFSFSLYDMAEGGAALWSESQYGVTVKGGNLTTDLGKVTAIPREVLERKELWLSVSVRSQNEIEFTQLTPRQIFNTGINAVSALTCPHSHFTDSWSGNSPSNGLAVSNYGGGDGIDAYSYSTRTNWAAVYAYDLAASGDGTGVYGASYYGSGVQAYSQHNDGLEVSSDTTWASALYAHSTNGNGVWAVSTNKIGVYATTANTTTNVAALEAYNSGTPSGGYGGKMTAKNYRGGFIGTLNYAWYGAVIDGGLYMTNGGCTGCTLAYIGQNNSDDAVVPGDLVAVAGVEVDTATNQPVMQVRLATDASDPVIGVVVSGTSGPGSQTSPDKIPNSKIMPGEYMLIAVSGLVQARVANNMVVVGDQLSPGVSGATVAADASNSVARVMSEPDENGLAWVLVDAR